MTCILILEDEPLIAMDLQLAFEDAGADVIVTVCCKEAFDAIQSTEFHGAVLDVNLGKGETCEAVALELKKRDIPFLLHTGDLDRTGEALRDLEAPILAKPSGAENVVSRLLGPNGELQAACC
ncbi:response regulator [Qipengyuania qiaonensis]|uniref:Response regulator n=1 Tax=Qipengyuania qiaonensis TaxID=2867240 RepID=A0ABS7JCE1_9SPHN|nr:response regulator [Qipengyuania qiaonensis]MBX7483724.1 response regulator [Qipengyuania qiaonensis]